MTGVDVPRAESDTKASVVKKYGKVRACSRKISSIRLAIGHGAFRWYQRRPDRTKRMMLEEPERLRKRAMMVPPPSATLRKKACGQRKGRPGELVTGSVPVSGNVVPLPEAIVATWTSRFMSMGRSFPRLPGSNSSTVKPSDRWLVKKASKISK